MAWKLTPVAHQIEVIANPEERVIEAARGRENNRLQLKLVVLLEHCTNKKIWGRVDPKRFIAEC